jgi:hypothetical protein
MIAARRGGTLLNAIIIGEPPAPSPTPRAVLSKMARTPDRSGPILIDDTGGEFG